MILKFLSVGVVALLLYGFSQRRHPRIHIPVMLAAFIADMSLVAVIELSRHAIEQAIHPAPSMVLRIHIGLSVVTVLLYLIQIGTGWLRWKRGGMKFHAYTGWTLLVFRLGNLVTSFLIPTHNLG
jgi:uncharacterized membrane protein YozB (DUF420 family)